MPLLAKAAIFAFVQFTSKTLLNLHIQFLSKRLMFDLVNNLPHKSIFEKHARLFLWYATLTHVE